MNDIPVVVEYQRETGKTDFENVMGKLDVMLDKVYIQVIPENIHGAPGFLVGINITDIVGLISKGLNALENLEED